MFLEGCKFVVKQKKIPKYSVGDIEISSDSERGNCMKKLLIKKILTKKVLMKKILMKKFFFLYIKMVNTYYQKNKEKLQKEARERYQNLSEEEKNKKRKYTRERYQYLTEEEKERRRQYDQEVKQKLPEYR